MQTDVTVLAIETKANPALMPELWQAVKRLIAWWASRYVAGSDQGSRLFDADDLIQAGYLALVAAVEGFDPEAGVSFVGYLQFHVRKCFAEVAGRRGRKHRPEVYADSLDAPIGDDTDTSRLDMLADPEAHFVYDAVVEDVSRQQAYAAILAEVDKLQDNQRQAITLHRCEGKTLQEAAAVMGVSKERVRQFEAAGFRKLRQVPEIQAIGYEYHHVGLGRFKQTFTSAVEEAILCRERRGYYRRTWA